MRTLKKAGPVPRSQSGSVLVASLAAMIVGTVLLAALLSLVSQTSVVEQSNVNVDRQIRAADAALATAINQVRNTPSLAAPAVGAPGDTPGGCLPFGLDEVTEVESSNPGGSPDLRYNPKRVVVDGVTVIVSCQDQGLVGPEKVPRDNGQPALVTVGGDYQDYVGVARADWEATPWRVVSGSPGLWSERLSVLAGGPSSSEVVNELLATDAQVVHVGSNEIRIIGDALVSTQAATLRTDPGGSPAMRVSGRYLQGGTGLFAGATGRSVAEQDELGSCGVLERGDRWGASSTDVRSAPRDSFQTVDDQARCSVSASELEVPAPPPATLFDNQKMQSRGNELTSDSGVRQDDPEGLAPNNDITPRPASQARPVGSGPLKGGLIVTLEGSFDARATKILNRWFRDFEATWWFKGDVFFDVFDGSTTGDSRHSLVMDNPKSNWVFGDANGWLPSTGRPPFTDDGTIDGSFADACNRAQPPSGSRGGSISLSSRTGLKHKQGRVVVCGSKLAGSAADFHTTAIFQRKSRPLGAYFKPSQDTLNTGDVGPFGITGGSLWQALREGGDGEFVDRYQSGQFCTNFGCIGTAISAGINAFLQWIGSQSPTCIDNGTCSLRQTIGVRISQPGVDVALPLADPVLEIQGSSLNARAGLQSTRIELTLSNGVQCSLEFSAATGPQSLLPSGPDQTVTYPLKAQGCVSVLSSAGVLQGAEVRVTFLLNPAGIPRSKVLGDAAFCTVAFWTWGRPCRAGYPGFGVRVDRLAVRSDWSASLRPGFSATALTGCGIDQLESTEGASSDGASGTCYPFPANTSVPFSNPVNGVLADGLKTRATVGNSNAWKARLRLNGVSDDSIADGWVPVDRLEADLTGLAQGGGLNTAASLLRVRLTLPKPVYVSGQGLVSLQCSRTLTVAQALANPRIEILNGTSKASIGSTCDWGKWESSGEWAALPDVKNLANMAIPDEVPIGDVVSWDDQETSSSTDFRFRERSLLDVEVELVGPANKYLELDSVRLTGRTKTGFDRPLAPFSVRWNPMQLNNLKDPVDGDATFMVFGSTVLPENAVEVRWGPRTATGSRSIRTGYGVFNGGNVPESQCNPADRRNCRPGLIAGAVGSWSTDNDTVEANSNVGWSGSPEVDPLATSGAYQDARRRFLLRACVVTGPGNDGQLGTWDDLTVKRGRADVTVLDRTSSRLAEVGAEVRVERYGITNQDQNSVQRATNRCEVGAYDG